MTSHSADVAGLAAYLRDLRQVVAALEAFVLPGAPKLTDGGWDDIHLAIYASHVSLDRNLPDVRAWLAAELTYRG